MNEPNLDTKTGRRDLTLLILLYGTAGRIGEILSIKVEHLHLDAPKPYVNLYGKGGKMRTAYILLRAASNLHGYLREFHSVKPCPSDFLFYLRLGGDRGKRTEPAIDKRIKNYAASAHEKCKETARLTDKCIELGESDIAALDLKFQVLTDRMGSRPEVTVAYFQPDERKDGASMLRLPVR